MTALALFALLLTLSAVFGVINGRTLRLPNTIGVLAISLLASFLLVVANRFVPVYDLHAMSRSLLGTINLPDTLLNGALSFLLFAGALQVDLRHLLRRWLAVLALAIIGTTLAVALFGIGMWIVFPQVDAAVPLVWCLVLGAILAPTDPVSVVGMLRRLGLPGPTRALFAGESLFNDGVGVVLFGVALGLATGTGTAAHGHAAGAVVALRFGEEAVGGGLIGLACGLLAVGLMRLTADGHVELIISLALATGAFSLANALGSSGPIAVVVAGLAAGAQPSQAMMTEEGREELMRFWSLIDEVLNALLFLLIGFEVLAVPFRISHFRALLAAIPLSVGVRAVSVLLSTLPVHVRRGDRGRTLTLLTWGGLRGGISVALALSLPDSPVRTSLLGVCYGVVVFTILVQGLTIERVVRRVHGAAG